MLTVQFWFEFASTYSYPASQRVGELAAAAGVAVEWRPFLLGPIFKRLGWNDSPFNLQAAKGRYMWRDLERTCAKHALPFRRPSVFPRNGLWAARVACLKAGEPWCPEFVRAVYRANFAHDQDITQADVLAGILNSLGQPSETVLAEAQGAGAKELLRVQMDEAERLGIFGAPTWVVGGELFWGNDRLEDAIAWARR